LYLTSWKDGGFSFSTENIGFIARVTPQGYQPEPLPDFKTASEAELLQLLQSKSHRRRLEAQRTLVRRGLKDSAVTAIKAVVLNPQAALEVRVAALFTLKQGLEARATSHLVEFTKDAALREHAIRALADRLEENKEVPTAPLAAGMKDENPRVRLAALVALARVNRLEPAPEMTALLADSDPIVRHTAVQALIALKASQACFSVVDNTSAPAPQRVGALRVLQGLHDTGVVGGLLERWSKETDALRRNGIISALCRLYHRDAEWKGSSWGTRPDTSGPYYEHATWAESNRILETLKSALAKSSGEETSHLLFEASRHKIQIDGALDKLINLASANPTLLPTLAEEVNRSGQLPVAAIPLLIQLAKQSDASSLARSQAVQSLTRSDAADAWSVILATNAELLKLGRNKNEVQKAREALINSPKLETQLPLLLSEAAKLNGASSLFAEAALLHLAAGKQGSVEGKAQAKQSIEAGFASPPRHVQLLEAIALIEARSYADQVLAAESHVEAAVAAAAKKAISQLKLDDPKKKPKSNSPLVESLKVEEVVERVLKTKGSVNAGLQLFAKLECAKCHTVKADETPKGPFLGTVASTYKRKELIEAILLPSKTLAQGFVTNQIITEDGKQHTGFVVLEAADKIVLRTVEAKEIVIPVAQIEERNKLTISVMPEGLVKKLTVEELASLVDYIESLPKK
jgi:putative heme-binding domain-containing protein